METLLSYDVAVVGGGPAGSATALRLVELGFSVALFDLGGRERQHVGESLPSSTRVALDALGVELPGDVVVARPPEHRVYWGEISGARSRRVSSPSESAMLVWRGALDRHLLAAAESAGADVFRDRAVRSAERSGDGWILHALGGACVGARFAVDASGRAGMLSRTDREREARFRTLAITGHFRSNGSQGPTLVEAFPDGWVWSAPLADGRRDVTVMVDADAAASIEIEKLYHASVLQAPRLRELLDAAERIGDLRGTDATPYLCLRPAARDFAAVGDAASFLDPLSAHGVHKALDGALVAAAVARTILERPERSEDAVRFHRERERDIFRATSDRLGRLYRQETRFASRPFWSKRSSEAAEPVSIAPRPPLRRDAALVPAPGAAIVEAPVLENDFVERRPVLVAPGRERPVRFLDTVVLPEVFARVVDAADVASAARALALPGDRALSAIDWLYRSGYLEHRA